MNIIVYIVVSTGGEYSDWYHNINNVFIDRDEAEKYIQDIRDFLKVINDFVFTPMGVMPDRDIIALNHPPNTYNRKGLINRDFQKSYKEYYDINQERFLKEFADYINHYYNNDEKKLKDALEKRYGYNIEVSTITDLEIEEVEITPSNKLYQLLCNR